MLLKAGRAYLKNRKEIFGFEWTDCEIAAFRSPQLSIEIPNNSTQCKQPGGCRQTNLTISAGEIAGGMPKDEVEKWDKLIRVEGLEFAHWKRRRNSVNYSSEPSY